MKRIALWLLPLALLAAAAWWLLDGRAREVKLAAARVGEAVELAYATGFVEAEQPVTVSARITAPVRQVLVEEAERVVRGQPLILLDDEEQRHALQQIAAQRRLALQDERRILALFVRRQNIWHNSRRRLAECGLRLGVDVRRRVCGVASADVRWSVA
ncbi:biotin/lipoyl-binding protein [Sphingobium sp. TKS]|uniref:biotin/lipoyl-binding protein n=1 Tax=Sphingobium sp. TKS TaxID=1315974 RepID=UPI0007703F33|nr:biotin/lipoyl-binding protein [Sphingobium sp. TKS]AMK26256.1 HlyD-family secretion protein [Sphingobium sp. TKS]